MKIGEARSLVDLIRGATFGELFFTSLVILPIFLGSWTYALKQFDEGLWGKELHILSILIAGYIITLTVLRIYQSKDQKYERAAAKIRSYLLVRNWTKVSFERIKEKIDPKYDQKFLKDMLEKFPSDFSTKGLSDGNTLIVLVEEEEES